MSVWLMLALSTTSGLAAHFQGKYGALEMFDAQAKLSFRVNPARLTVSLPACAAGYLFVSAQALQSGKLSLQSSQLRYDPARYPASAHWPASWQRDQDLRQALRAATPWYFAELHQRLGQGAWQARAKQAGFANVQAPPEQWTGSVLAQVGWIQTVRNGLPGLSAAGRSLLRDSLLRSDDAQRSQSGPLYEVAARCDMPNGTAIGWTLGWVERATAPVYYGVVVEADDRAALRGEAARIIRGALAEMRFIVNDEHVP